MRVLVTFALAAALAPGVSARSHGTPPGPHAAIATRTIGFTRIFEECGDGYSKIVTLLQHPQDTTARQVLQAITRLRRRCARKAAALAGGDTSDFGRAARDAEGAIRAYRSSLVHLARYARTQNLTELHAAQIGFLDASSRDLTAQREINAIRRGAGLAALPLRDRASAAGMGTTTID